MKNMKIVSGGECCEYTRKYSAGEAMDSGTAQKRNLDERLPAHLPPFRIIGHRRSGQTPGANARRRGARARRLLSHGCSAIAADSRVLHRTVPERARLDPCRNR